MASSKPIVEETEIKVEETKPDTETSVKVLEQKANASINVKERGRKALAQRYLSEKKVPVTISPLYRPYLGNVVPVLVNGIRVDIPADGRTYEINETHAGEIIAKIRRIDNMMARQKKAGNVSDNFESHIGELQI